MVRVVVLGESQAGTDRQHVRYVNPARVLWVQDGGPGFCYLAMTKGALLKVLGPASELAKRLATSEPESGEAVA